MPAGDRPTFGGLLRRHRMDASLSREALAKLAGLSADAIDLLERGRRKAPRPETVGRLAATLDLAPAARATFIAAATAARTAGPAELWEPGVEAQVHGSNFYPLLAGRSRELDLLERHLAGIGPPVLLWAGEPGIGKSRLLAESTTRAAGYGLRTLIGSCQQRGGQEPYSPLLEAVHGYLRRCPPAHLRVALQGCAWLVRLLPELAGGPIEPLPAWTLSPEQERRLLFEAVARVVANVAGPAGTLLVLDDLQWAGPDALDLLVTLVRATSDLPVLVVGAYRDTEVQPSDPPAVTLTNLIRAGLATHRTLAPLNPAESEQLLAGLLEGESGDGGEHRERVLQRAGGVPFFIVSCAQLLRSPGIAEGGDGRIPWDVTQSIRQRVAMLPEPAQEVLSVAATIGRVAPPALLLSVAEQPEQDVLAALRAAYQAHLLVEGEQGYQFAHDLIREVVEADAGAAQRLVLHRRVAAALERAPGEVPLEQLIYHYGRGGQPDKAVRYLEQAGDRALAQGANAAADGYYQQLVAHLDLLGQSSEAARAREKLATVFVIVARYEAALAVLERAAHTYQAAADLESLARVSSQIGRVYSINGQPDEGVQRVQPVLGRLEASRPSRGLVALYCSLANLFSANSRYGESLVASERAVHLARAVGDQRLLARAVRQRGWSLYTVGRLADALQVLEEVIPVVTAAGDLDSLACALADGAIIYLHVGDFAKSRAYSERALEVSTRIGDPAQMTRDTMLRGYIAYYSGDWYHARQHGEQALAMSIQIGPSWVSAYHLAVLGVVSYGEGRWGDAVRYLEECVALARRMSDNVPLRMAQGVLAELELRTGRSAEAQARLAPLLHGANLAEHEIAALQAKRSWAQLELGELDQAAAGIAQALTHLRARNDRLTLVDALRIHALVLMRQAHQVGRENLRAAGNNARWDQAAQALDEGIALAHGMAYPYAEARLLHVYAQLHRQEGAVPSARARLEAALAIYQQLGARKDVESARQSLAALQQEPPAPAAIPARSNRVV